MSKASILWVDDEIDLLKPHTIFLQSKDYEISTVNNGNDAIDLVTNNLYDIVFLDENMPGMSGIETLRHIKSIRPQMPIVMITKSEEEFIMDEAIGSQINDYLIKPVNPMQILMTIKKITEQKRLVSEKTTLNYQSHFMELGDLINSKLDAKGWIDVHKKLVYWDLELLKNGTEGMEQLLHDQKNEAENRFARFVKDNYVDWISAPNSSTPTHSATMFRNKIMPVLQQGRTLLLVIDNFRFDQWKVLEPLLTPYYNVTNEDIYYSILPTSTQFARNALFAGLMPSEIQKLMPNLWVNENEDESKNAHEDELLRKQLTRLGANCSLYFDKIHNLDKSQRLTDCVNKIMQNDLSVIVVNFVDMLSHARTEMNMIKELVSDEKAYRSITCSWFEHSTLFDLLKLLADKNINIVITTDHGTTQVSNPIKVVGDKEVSLNLRYKHGKQLTYNPREVFEIKNPQSVCLPRLNVSSSYIFAFGNNFFTYPNNYNHYVSYYRNTFQHGGISMDEMLIPVITLAGK